jgi:hypothetical protein
VALFAIFVGAGRFSLSVLAGGFLSAALASANFILLAETLQKALKQDAAKAKLTVTVSLFLRYLAILILSVVFILLGADAIAVLIPLFFPRIVIFLTQIHKTGGANGN